MISFKSNLYSKIRTFLATKNNPYKHVNLIKSSHILNCDTKSLCVCVCDQLIRQEIAEGM
jgi:uncharacterized HAD superfamily protein